MPRASRMASAMSCEVTEPNRRPSSPAWWAIVSTVLLSSAALSSRLRGRVGDRALGGLRRGAWPPRSRPSSPARRACAGSGSCAGSPSRRRRPCRARRASRRPASRMAWGIAPSAPGRGRGRRGRGRGRARRGPRGCRRRTGSSASSRARLTAVATWFWWRRQAPVMRRERRRLMAPLLRRASSRAGWSVCILISIRRRRGVSVHDAGSGCERPEPVPRIRKMCREAPARLHRTLKIVMLVAWIW